MIPEWLLALVVFKWYAVVAVVCVLVGKELGALRWRERFEKACWRAGQAEIRNGRLQLEAQRLRLEISEVGLIGLEGSPATDGERNAITNGRAG